MTTLNFRTFMERAPTGKKKIAIFDFDGTLVLTPGPEEGMDAYKRGTGKPWKIQSSSVAIQHGFDPKMRRTGWWGRKETLESPIFEPTEDKLNPTVVAALQQARQDTETYTVVMTGRHGKLENRVKEILNMHNIYADEYFFRGHKDLTKMDGYPHRGDTLDYKVFVILNRLMSPEIRELEIWDDRAEHIARFVQFGNSLIREWPKLELVTVHDVTSGKIHRINK